MEHMNMSDASAASSHAHHHHDHAAMSTPNVDLVDSPMGKMDMGNNGTMHHMMMMYFHTGYSETILFESWKIDSVGGLLWSMLVIFIMATSYEGLKYFRDYLFRYNSTQMVHSVSVETDKGLVTRGTSSAPEKMLSSHHVLQTGLHLVQIVLSYFLMLIFMTFNVWLCMAVAAGSGVGFFLFGWRKSLVVDITEHCH